MNLRKALERERKQHKRKSGMVIDSKSVFTIQRIQKERAEQIRKERENKEKLLELLED
jgi:hypothetical protein